MDETRTPVVARKNQYRGVNAHLNSLLQADGWEAFHTHHVTEIQVQLNDRLLGSGYVVLLEESLQIRRQELPPRQPESDVMIRDFDPRRSAQGPASFILAPGMPTPDRRGAVDLVAAPDDGEYFAAFRAISIRLADARQGQPVAWIELLSPSNKPGGRHAAYYLDKRAALLGAATCVFVEIDYLHETPPTILDPSYPDYTRGDAEATAYRVLVADTRETGIWQGSLYVFSFGVDEPIPTFPIPLHGQDSVALDLGAAYDQTYTRAALGVSLNTRVDYRERPIHFERYSAADQARILARCRAVVAAREAGIDLETVAAPLAVE
jgi:hypothetical protein